MARPMSPAQEHVELLALEDAEDDRRRAVDRRDRVGEMAPATDAAFGGLPGPSRRGRESKSNATTGGRP